MFVYENLLNNLHSSKRIENITKLFGEVKNGGTRIVLLDFMGDADHFITDFGCVFHRKKLYPNTKGLVTKGYSPMVVLDPLLPYKWVKLDTAMGDIWFPINQILGWAFQPQPNRDVRYFLNHTPEIYPSCVDTFAWTDKLDLPDNSRFKQFIDLIYSTK